jgi:hypothetical protein
MIYLVDVKCKWNRKDLELLLIKLELLLEGDEFESKTLKSICFIEPNSIIEEEKTNYFFSVMKDYSIQELEKLIPRK